MKVKCPKCGCEVLKEHLNLDCHAHNNTNLWRSDVKGEIYEVFRTKVLDVDTIADKQAIKGK